MADVLTDDDVGISNVLTDVDVGISAPSAPRNEYDYLAPLPPINAEQLGDERVSHPALPLMSPAPAAKPANEYDYLQPLPPITAKKILEMEQYNARREIGPTTEYLASGWKGPTTESAAALASPIGLRIRPYTTSGPQPAVVEGIRGLGKAIADIPVGMAQPEMLPLAPLAALPIPGAPALRHAIPRAMGLLFGGQSIGTGAADIVTGIEQEEPGTVGRGVANVLVGSGMSAPSVMRSIQLPRAMDALRAEARFEAAKNITPKPPLQLPERGVVPSTPEPPLAPVPAPKPAPVPAPVKAAPSAMVKSSKSSPMETREAAEMKRVQALPEGPEGEAQLVAEDIAKAVEAVDVTDVAGFSPVPALVRVIRRAARDPAMKTAAEQAMQKIGAAAREQGVSLDTIKQEIAGELKAIYGADAPEMAKAFFGEEKPAGLTPEEQAAARAQLEQEVPAAQPIEAEATKPTPTQLEKDIQDYNALAKRYKELAATGNFDSPEFQSVFQQVENLKNKYGGNVPGKPVAPKPSKQSTPPTPAPPAKIPPGTPSFFSRRSEAQGLGEPSLPPTVEDVRQQRQRDLAPPPSEPPPSEPSPPPESEGATITDEPKRQDVMPARNWWTSSEFQFQTLPEAASLVTKLVEAELGYGAQVGRDIQRLNDSKANLTAAEQLQATKAARAAQKGNPAPLAALPEKLRAAVAEVRNYFDDVKKVIIAEKKRELIEALPGARGRAVQDILGGMTEAQAFRKNRLRDAGKATVRSALQELKELDSWGPEDYVTNIERGSYHVVDPNGTTVAISLTRVGAKEKALQYSKEHPEVKSLTITDQFDPGVEAPTKLSKGQYHRTISRLSQAIGETASEVQRLLRADGAVIAIKPTSKYAGALQKRRNILKGEDNLWDALPTYAYSVRKKLALDPVLKEVRESLNTLPENARQQVEELANDVKGRKTVADKMVDYLLSPMGTKPFGYSRGVNLARGITTIAKLGYRPTTALINRLGGLHHTWTRAGTQWLVEGRRFMKSPEFKEVWEANRDYVGDAATAFTEGAKPGDVAWWHPMSMFQWAEKVNRPEAFATFYRFAQGELKMSPPDAANYARFQTRLAQFVYTTGSLPRMFRGPTGRLVGQFKPYLVKELEFMASLNRQQWPRYLAGFMLLGGPRAAVYMLRSLPILGAAGILYALEDWLNRKAPAASRGVGGAAGVDLTAAVTPQLPSKTEDWAGPTLSAFVTLYRDIIEPAMSGEKRDARDLAQWGAKLAPMTSYWYDLVESALHREGWNVDAQGRPDYKPSTADKIKMAAGAQPLEKSIQAVERRYLNHLDEITRANRKHLVDRFIRALDGNDNDEMNRMINQFADYGITSNTIKDAMKQRHLEPRERLRQRLLKVIRVQESERFSE